MISELSEGIPRNINNICFNALSLGCSLGQKMIDVEVLQQVAADFDLAGLRSDPGMLKFRAGDNLPGQCGVRSTIPVGQERFDTRAGSTR